MSSRAVPVECGVKGFHRLSTDQFILSDITFPEKREVVLHHHLRHCISLVISGSTIKSFNGNDLIVTGASAVSTPAGESHVDQFVGGGTHVVTVEVAEDGDQLPEILEPCADFLSSVHAVRSERIARIARQLSNELREPDDLSALTTSGLVFELLASTTREVASQPSRQPPAWLMRARDYLHDHRTRLVQIEEVARAVDIHPAYLARMFREHFGHSPGAYARRLRLEAAAVDLQATDRPILEIAITYGFSDQSHFTRHFRRHYGVTPARYRADLGA